MEGRGYYMTPAYPMLFAGGAVAWDRWTGSPPPRPGAGDPHRDLFDHDSSRPPPPPCSRFRSGPCHSPLWNARLALHREFTEEIGWDDLAATVAQRLVDAPAAGEERTAGIFAGNYGEAGAVNLYRDRYGLPEAISGTNSYWYRGPGDPPPRTLILLGVPLEDAQEVFEQCAVAARLTNRWGVENEESRDHPDVLLCRRMKVPWSVVWREARSFG